MTTVENRKTDGRTAMWVGVIAGASLTYVLACGASALELNTGVYAPMLFGVPAAVGFVLAGRLRWLGAVFIALAFAGAYYAAFFSAVQTYSRLSPNLCLFCSAEQAAAAAPQRIVSEVAAGLAGGFVGSLASFLALALISRDLRDKRAQRMDVLSVAVLALIGGLTTTLAMECSGDLALLGNFLLFTPWQLVFGWLLILLLGPRDVSGRRAGALA